MTKYINGLEAAFIAVTKGRAYRPRHAEIADDFWAQMSGADTLALIMLDLARSSDMAIASLETCLFIILGQYMNMLDPILHDGARSLDLFPRFAGP